MWSRWGQEAEIRLVRFLSAKPDLRHLTELAYLILQYRGLTTPHHRVMVRVRTIIKKAATT